MPRRTKKRSLTADISKIITTVLHSALGLFLLGVLLIVAFIGILLLLTGNNYHLLFLILGILFLLIIAVAWLRYYMHSAE